MLGYQYEIIGSVVNRKELEYSYDILIQMQLYKLLFYFVIVQFIIVSLKDGMFNNANVLFRTRFVDGMSAVQRTIHNSRQPVTCHFQPYMQPLRGDSLYYTTFICYYIFVKYEINFNGILVLSQSSYETHKEKNSL